MLGPIFAHALVTGRLVCPQCKSCLMAAGIRYVSQTHYDILGLSKTASQTEVRQAFITLSKKLHPDINRKDPKNHDKFVTLNEAYSVLSKPIARREYDMNLAVRLNMEQQAKRASSSHVHGSSPWPGSNAGQTYDGDQQRFWDETLFHMRDQSKDKDYEDKPYYGFNIRRLSNLDIMLACMALMTAGAVFHFYAIRKSTELHKVVLDEKDKKYHSNLVKARENAKAHGNALQLQILQSKVNNTPLQVPIGMSEKNVKDTFSPVKKP